MIKSWFYQKKTKDVDEVNNFTSIYNTSEPIVPLEEACTYDESLYVVEDEVSKVYKLQSEKTKNTGYVILFKNNIKPMKILYKYSDIENFNESLIKTLSKYPPTINKNNNDTNTINKSNIYNIISLTTSIVIPILVSLLITYFNFNILIILLFTPLLLFPQKRIFSWIALGYIIINFLIWRYYA